MFKNAVENLNGNLDKANGLKETAAVENDVNIRKNRSALSSIFRRFAENTACHGVVHIVKSRYIVVKLIWTLLLMGSLGMVIFQLYDSIIRYQTYPVKTVVSVEHTALPFPTVTICNANPIRFSKRNEAPPYFREFIKSIDPNPSDDGGWSEKRKKRSAVDDVEELPDWIREAQMEEVTNHQNHNYKNKNPNQTDTSRGERQRQKREFNPEEFAKNFNLDIVNLDIAQENGGWEEFDPQLTIFATYKEFIARVNESLRYELAHDIKNMLLICSYEGQKCSITNFTKALSHDYGVCYSFNVEDQNTKRLLKASQSGNIYGLSMTLYVEPGEYTPGLTQGYGFRVSVSRTGIRDFPEISGLYIPAGTETDIGLRLTNITRLGMKYGDCLDDHQFQHRHKYRYSRQHCRNICAHNYTANICKCYKLSYVEFYSDQQLETLSPCGKEDIGCITGVFNRLTEKELDCQCPSPCVEYVYESTLSWRKWPIEAYRNTLWEDVCKVKSTDCATLYSQEFSKFRENFVKLNIFYRDLNYERVTEEPDLPATTLLSQSGGIVAFWIGMSVLSLIEILQLIAQVLVYALNSCFGLCKDPHIF